MKSCPSQKPVSAPDYPTSIHGSSYSFYKLGTCQSSLHLIFLFLSHISVTKATDPSLLILLPFRVSQTWVFLSQTNPYCRSLSVHWGQNHPLLRTTFHLLSISSATDLDYFFPGDGLVFHPHVYFSCPNNLLTFLRSPLEYKS